MDVARWVHLRQPYPLAGWSVARDFALFVAAGGSRAGAAGRFIRRSNASPATTATSGVTSGCSGRTAAMLVEDSQQLGFQANSGNPRRLWQSTISYTRETSWRPRCGSQPLGKVPDRRRRDRLFPVVVIHISVSRKFPSGDHEGTAGFLRGQHHNE